MVSGDLPQIGGAPGSVEQRLTPQVSVIAQRNPKVWKVFGREKDYSADGPFQRMETVLPFTKTPF